LTTETDYGRFAEALRGDFDALVRQWVEAYTRSVIRIPRPVPEGEITRLAAPILESLADMVAPSKGSSGVAEPNVLTPGAAHVREVEKSAAFVGAKLASTEYSGFDVAALVLALRDVLTQYTGGGARDELYRFFEWLAILAVDSFSAARAKASIERMRDQLEDGTPVVLVHREVPAALLVGAPDPSLVHSIFSRLTLLAVRVDAAGVIIDASGLAEPGSPGVLEALERLLEHRKIHGKVEVFAVGLDPEPEKAWLSVAKKLNTAMSAHRDFDRAVEAALAKAGYRVVRTSSP
jgi:hypothetical protein